MHTHHRCAGLSFYKMCRFSEVMNQMVEVWWTFVVSSHLGKMVLLQAWHRHSYVTCPFVSPSCNWRAFSCTLWAYFDMTCTFWIEIYLQGSNLSWGRNEPHHSGCIWLGKSFEDLSFAKEGVRQLNLEDGTLILRIHVAGFCVRNEIDFPQASILLAKRPYVSTAHSHSFSYP